MNEQQFTVVLRYDDDDVYTAWVNLTPQPHESREHFIQRVIANAQQQCAEGNCEELSDTLNSTTPVLVFSGHLESEI